MAPRQEPKRRSSVEVDRLASGLSSRLLTTDVPLGVAIGSLRQWN
jgi:hypothetical protein